MVQMWGGFQTFWLLFFEQKDWYFSKLHKNVGLFMNYILSGSPTDYTTLVYPTKIDRFFFQHSMAMSIISIFCFLPIWSFFFKWRSSLLVSLIPFAFQIFFFLTLDFNLDFADDGNATI